MKNCFLLFAVVGLSACATSTSQSFESAGLELADWHGQPLNKVVKHFGSGTSLPSSAQGYPRMQVEQLWVLGAAGERYRTYQNDYPVRGGGANKEPGGFNAKVLRCVYTFELGAHGLTVRAQVTPAQCPAPQP
jgi:hypothetical protein